jgi:hypothetical protein
MVIFDLIHTNPKIGFMLKRRQKQIWGAWRRSNENMITIGVSFTLPGEGKSQNKQ